MTTNSIKTTLLLGALTGLILVAGQLLGGRSGMLLALGCAALLNFGAYWFSDKIVLARYRAKPVPEAEAPRLHAMLDRLVARGGLPKPRLYILPEKAANAFATGRNPAHAAVAVTAGLLETMDAEETEGVIAHELAHIKNRDILISSVAATIAGAITFLASIARWGAIFGGFGSRDGERGANPLGLLFLAILAPVAALIIQMAVSRSREYAADATGAEMAGNPYGLARALEKLDRASRRIPLEATPATSHLFIVMPLGGGLGRLFSTHPPIEERIRRLTGR